MPSNNLPKVIAAAQGAVQSTVARFSVVYWFNPATPGDLCTLTDNNGAIIWEGRCETANISQVFYLPNPVTVDGYQVTVLGSGTLLLY